MEQQVDYVLRTVEERGIRFIRLWFTDVLGSLKSVAITPADLQEALEEGVTFDGSAIEGYTRVQEADMIAVPDPQTFELLPWSDADASIARMFCDIRHLDGEPFDGDPRQVLRRNLERAREKGFQFFAGPELEYFYFDSDAAPIPLDRAGYFDQSPQDIIAGLRKETILTLEALGIPVDRSFHENAPSQQEIDLRYDDALSMADNVMTCRHAIKKIAEQFGVYATFMPKPISNEFGSAMHTHFSLFEGETNAFADPGDEYGLSKIAKSFIAGLIEHAREITAVTNQWVNSYKRLASGYEAPIYACWGPNNRSALVRVPIPKASNSSSTRIEYRSPDPACNPYLAFAVVLAAGLKGIEEGYELPPEANNNIYEMTPMERLNAGIRALPSSLDEAITAMENSELVAEALGEHTFEYFIRSKRHDWNDYKGIVTPYEIEEYLGVL